MAMTNAERQRQWRTRESLRRHLLHEMQELHKDVNPANLHGAMAHFDAERVARINDLQRQIAATKRRQNAA